MTLSTIIDLRRNSDARLEVSRIACDLIWERGLSGTRGEDIADTAGIATRTLWRYFRSKEACIEPVLAEAAERFTDLLASWPVDSSLEEHLAESRLGSSPESLPDDLRAMRLIGLADTEPAIRSAWLSVCHDAEARLAVTIAERLQLDSDSLAVRRIAAATGGALRVVNEEISRLALAGTTFTVDELLVFLAEAVRSASGELLGDAMEVHR